MDIQSKQIEKEIEDWINETLSKPSKIFGNLPPCPYARKAWKENKVKVITNQVYKTFQLEDHDKLRSGDLDLIMIVQEKTNVEDLYKLKYHLEEYLGKDFVILEDHPELKEEVAGINLNFGKPVLFVQNRKKLTEARKFLKNTEYYNNFDEEYKNDVLSH